MRVGILGCGQMGQRRARALTTSPDVLTHGYDTDTDRLAGWATEFGARPASTAEELVAGVDTVIVSTPNAFLAPYTELSLDHGRPVLVEKPGALDADTLAGLVSRARARQVPLQVGYSLVQHGAVDAFLAAAEAVGEPRYLRAAYGHGGRPGMGAEWRADPARSGGGELLDQGVHLIHLAIRLLGPVTGVRAVLSCGIWGLPVEDTAALLLTHERGSASLTASWCFWQNEFRLDVTGPRGSAHLHGLGGNYGPERLTVRSRRPHLAGPPLSTEVDVPVRDVWETEWADFAELVRAGGPGNGAQAVSVLRVIEQARRHAGR